jgi:spermidine synthase
MVSRFKSALKKAGLDKQMDAQGLPAVTLSEVDGVRHLHLGTPWVQGSMRIKKPDELELEYIERMMAWMLLRPADQVDKGHALQLGLGAAAITKFTYKKMHMRTTAVELNPKVVHMCRQWFALPENNERLQVILDNAQSHVANPEHHGKVHALSVDLYDHEAACPVLDDAVFYQHCWDLLANTELGGVMAVNLFGRDASFARSLELIGAAFKQGHVYTMTATRDGNTVVLASKGLPVPDRSTLLDRAQAIEEKFGLSARSWLRMLRQV